MFSDVHNDNAVHMLCVYMIRIVVYNVLNALYGYKCMLDVYIIRIVVYNVLNALYGYECMPGVVVYTLYNAVCGMYCYVQFSV